MATTKAQDPNLASRVDEAVDYAVDELIGLLNDAKRFRQRKVLHSLALEAAGLTARDLEYISEHDESNPRLELYYATLTCMLQKVLGRTADRMSF